MPAPCRRAALRQARATKSTSMQRCPGAPCSTRATQSIPGAPDSEWTRRRTRARASTMLSVNNCRINARPAPQRHAQTKFLAPASGASQQQVGEIDANDQQDQSNSAPQHLERTLQLSAHLLFEAGQGGLVVGVAIQLERGPQTGERKYSLQPAPGPRSPTASSGRRAQRRVPNGGCHPAPRG
jgi:hypothetical protein